jgi:hypothetical protein
MFNGKCPVCNPTFHIGGKPIKPSKPIKLIYIACALTAPTEFERNLNIQAARHAGYKIAKAGFYPVMPTVNTEGFEDANTLDFWYRSTMELLRRCDAVYVVNGSHESSGVKAEVCEAVNIGLPVFESIELIHC